MGDLAAVLLIVVLAISLLANLYLYSQLRAARLDNDHLRRQFRELQLSKAADERRIQQLESQLSELEWQIRRGK